jgi:DNA-binding CsgD family transcriptional regulator
LLFGLGRAQAATARVHQMQEAIDTLGRALDYYAKVGDASRAMAVVEYPFTIWPGFTRANELIARALDLVPPDSPEAGRLFSRYGFSLSAETGDFQKAQEAFSRALAIARRQHDVLLEMRTLASVSHMDLLNLRFPESLEKSLSATELTNLVDDPYAAFLAHYSAFLCLWMMGDLGGMQQHAASTLTVADRLRDRYSMAAATWFLEWPILLEGNWNAARDYNERSLAAASSPMFPLSTRAKLEYEIGDFVQGDAYLERLMDTIDLVACGLFECSYFSLTIPAISRITGAIDHFDRARKAAEDTVSAPYAFPMVTLLARVGLATMAVQRGDSRAALEQYAALEAKRGPVLYTGWLCLDRLLGLLAHTMGNPDTSAEHFEDALTLCRKSGCRPELAWTCYDYANALYKIGQNEKPLALLDEALAISTELGMRPLIERIVALRDRASSQPIKTPVYPDALTQREVEVLRLIAAGKSNRDIADELFIGTNTVANHVKNILSKTGSTNRTEAAAYAMRHGLAP